MTKLVIAATALLASTAALGQTTPVAAPPAPPAPMAHPMGDRVTSRAEAVEMVREHFSELDANKDGSITTEEATSRAPTMARKFEFKHGDGPRGMMAGAPRGDPDAAFDRLDANKDGMVSREEYTKAREERIERRMVLREELKEKPGDGKDMRKHVMRMHHGPGAMHSRMIVLSDSNKDGKITLAEAEAMTLQHFDEMDTNKDGQLTPEERRSGAARLMRKYADKKSDS